MSYYYEPRVCHWCGGEIPMGMQSKRRGLHDFCCTAHRVAHHRAYTRWLATRVTSEARCSDQAAAASRSKRNSDKPAGSGATSAGDPSGPGRRRNTRKGTK